MYIQMIDSLSLLSTSQGLGDQGLVLWFFLLSLLTMACLVVGWWKDDTVPVGWGLSALPVEKVETTEGQRVFLGMDLQGEEPTLPPLPVIQVQGKTLLDKYLQPIKATVVVVEEYFETAILLPWEEEAVAEGYGSYGFVL